MLEFEGGALIFGFDIWIDVVRLGGDGGVEVGVVADAAHLVAREGDGEVSVLAAEQGG